MKEEKPLLITLNNYPESCNLCRIGLAYTYVDVLKKVMHDHFVICAVKSGRLIHRIGDEQLELRRGDMFIVPPGVAHTEEYVEQDTSFYLIDFSQEFMCYDPLGYTIKDRLLTFLLIDTYLQKKESLLVKVPLSADDQIYLFKEIERFYYEFNNRREGMFEILNSILMTILNVFGWKYLYQPRTFHVEQKYHRINKTIYDSIEYIHGHYQESLKIEDVLVRFATSRTVYCTLFKQIIGVTFHEYLTNLRCEKSAQLLSEREKTLEEIADMTGFKDVPTLYRNFVKKYGVSPGEYRKQHIK